MGPVLGIAIWRLKCALNWAMVYSGAAHRYEWRHYFGDSNAITPGETPEPVLKMIALAAGFRSGMRVLDLGCGRGTALAYWSMLYGIHPIGIERVRSVAHAARLLLQSIIATSEILTGDFFGIVWPEVDAVVVSTTCFSAQDLDQLMHRYRQLPTGTVVVQISNDVPMNELKCIWRGSHRFPWGNCPISVFRCV
ncbi:class I SAM-dependent methyltransferase [bacterium]|nr:class I SAM-dependent methyltransferase [bacterium]